MDWRETLTQALRDSLTRLFPYDVVYVESATGSVVHFLFKVTKPVLNAERFGGVLCASETSPHILWSDHYRWTFKETPQDMYLYLKNLTREEVEGMVY